MDDPAVNRRPQVPDTEPEFAQADANEISDRPETSGPRLGGSAAAVQKQPGTAAKIDGLRDELHRKRTKIELQKAQKEKPKATVKRLEKEKASASMVAAAVMDHRQLPQEIASAEAGKVGKSKKVAEAWAVSREVTDEQAAAVLVGVRKRAESWRTGTASVLGVITATLVLGGDTFTSIKASAKVLPHVPYAMAVSVLFALASLYFTLRAANGPAFLDTKIRETVGDAAERDLRRAGAAAYDLKRAQVLLAIAVVIFLAALVAIWVAPPG